MKWLDSRLYKPSCNSADYYFVCYKMFPDSHMTSIGWGLWMPTDGYTDGEWDHVCSRAMGNQGKHEVLYWQRHPNYPRLK